MALNRTCPWPKSRKRPVYPSPYMAIKALTFLITYLLIGCSCLAHPDRWLQLRRWPAQRQTPAPCPLLRYGYQPRWGCCRGSSAARTGGCPSTVHHLLPHLLLHPVAPSASSAGARRFCSSGRPGGQTVDARVGGGNLWRLREETEGRTMRRRTQTTQTRSAYTRHR